MMLENLIPLALVVAAIFGALWLFIEVAALLGDRRS